MSEPASEQVSAAECASNVNRVEQANEQTEKQVAQYSVRLDS